MAQSCTNATSATRSLFSWVFSQLRVAFNNPPPWRNMQPGDAGSESKRRGVAVEKVQQQTQLHEVMLNSRGEHWTKIGGCKCAQVQCHRALPGSLRRSAALTISLESLQQSESKSAKQISCMTSTCCTTTPGINAKERVSTAYHTNVCQILQAACKDYPLGIAAFRGLVGLSSALNF